MPSNSVRRSWQTEEVEEIIEAANVRPSVDHAGGEKAFDLGTPQQPAVGLGVEQGTDAHAIAPQVQGAPRAVPKRDAELPVGLVEHLLAQVFVEMNPRFGVAVRQQPMAPRQQALADLRIVVKLPFVGHPHIAGLVGERLPAVGHVDHRQAANAQSEARFLVDPLVVRSPMRQGAGHAQQTLLGEIPTAG